MDEPTWLTREIVEYLHSAQVREHGGQLGLRDEDLLESALARPRQVWTYESDVDLARLAAEYAFGLCNTRVAFVTAATFLVVIGYEIGAPEPAVVDAMVRLADGRLDRDGLAAWIRSTLQPAER